MSNSTKEDCTGASDLIKQLKQQQDEGYLYINQALTSDEFGQIEQALVLYKKGLQCIHIAKTIWNRIEQSSSLDQSEKDKLSSIVEKMVNSEKKTQSRIDEISSDLRLRQQNPPSYEAATASTVDGSARSSSFSSPVVNAAQLFLIADGVQIFFISENGLITAPSYPSFLGVYQFTDHGNERPDRPPAFLQVGDWIFPLLPGISPALHANCGAYMFPNFMAENPGCFVGVIIPDYISPDERKRFEDLLHSLTDLRHESDIPHGEEESRPAETGQQAERTSQKISKGLIVAAEWISWGVSKGVEKTGHLVKYGSTKLREHVRPAIEKSKIDPRAQKGIEYAHKATDGAVKVSGYLVSKLGEVTSALGRSLGPHVRRHSENLLPKSWTRRDSATGRSTVDDVTEVVASGIQGFGMVYNGLEQSAKLLAKSIANETVQIVEHKYGTDAGQFTQNVVFSAGNVAMAAHNLSHLGVKAIAKRTALDTGIATVNGHSSNTETAKTNTSDTATSKEPNQK